MTILSSYGGTVSLVARTADPVTRDAMPRICLLVEGRPIDWQAGPDAEWRATFAVTPGLNLLRVAQRGAAQAPEALTPVLRLTDVRLLFESGRQS